MVPTRMTRLCRWCSAALCAVLLTGCASGVEEPERILRTDRSTDFAVIRHFVAVGPYHMIPYYGDIWANTWADDGHVYALFGDGTGMRDRLPTLLPDEPDEFDELYEEVRPGWYRVKDPAGAGAELCEVYDCSKAYRLAPFTPIGMVRLRGSVPQFRLGNGPDQDVVARHIPYGTLKAFETMDKPSSVVAIGDRLYAHLHYPAGEPVRGYLAFSDDQGKTWHSIKGSPWGADSPFRVVMFFQMGRGYSLNWDGYLYGLGIAAEVDLEQPAAQPVYLLRVPLSRPAGAGGAADATSSRPDPAEDPVLDYSAYEYFAGYDMHGQPRWRSDPEDAAVLSELSTWCQGSAMYHAGLDRFLFLAGWVGEARWAELAGHQRSLVSGPGKPRVPWPAAALYEAPHPWGPWRLVGRFPGGFIASFIAKDATPTSVYYAAAGGGGVPYALNIARIEFRPRVAPRTPARFTVLTTRKVEQVIGDVDFETLQPTRQQTESRYGIAHTDLGASFEHKGRLWFLFGDSDPEAPGWDERHDDAIAWTDATSVDEFRLHFLRDPRRPRGYANPRIVGVYGKPDESLDVDLGALNVPLAGISLNDKMFVWFTTGGAERSLVACSEDDGKTFLKVYDFGSSHFIDVAVARWRGKLPDIEFEPDIADWVLIFGSGDHTHRHVYLAATPVEALVDGDRDRVYFLSGIGWHRARWPNGSPRLRWARAERAAVPLFRIEHGAGPGVMSEVPHGWGFGEPLVHYNRTLGCWVATYNSARRTIRLRTAPAPWGPWSESIVLFDPERDYGDGPARGRYIGDGKVERLGHIGELYGPYVIERFTRRHADGTVSLYWLLSPWQPYTVLLMESRLRPISRAPIR